MEDEREDTQVPAVTPEAPSLSKVAIIIDDLGHSERDSAAALNLPPEVAFAILPYGMSAKALAQKARERRHEVILHLPMQPKNTGQNPGPNALMTDLSAAQLRARITWNLSQIEGVYAVNNHMGSAFTENVPGMQLLFEELAKFDLAFFDSRTTAASKSVEMASRYRVPMAERDVFLDNAIEASAVEEQLHKLEVLAKQNGSAIAIGHPHGVTFEQIAVWVPSLEAKGLMLVAPSEILRDRATPYWRQIVRTARRQDDKRGAF